MAKNITIREGDTSKQFTAKKLKVNQVGGGTVNFIPEDEALDYVDVEDHVFREKGVFNPSDFNCDAFGKVTIDIPSNVKEKTITKNGTFNAADDGCLGYSKVTIAVPTGGGGGPYTVRFFDGDGNVIKTDANVPYDGTASCTLLDGTKKDDQYFIGWNPVPKNVHGDMNCYPVYGDYIIDINETHDSWETICADGGAHYPLGTYKSLNITIPAPENMRHELHNVYIGGNLVDASYTYGGITALTITMDMVKVAEGEDGSTSSWLSTGTVGFGEAKVCPRYTANVNTFADYYYYNRGDGVIVQTLVNMDWGNVFLRQYLNEYFIQFLPSIVAANVKEVTKTYSSWGVAPSAGVYNVAKVDKTSLDKIWVPSMKELHALFAAQSNYSDYAVAEEFTGIDYSSVYVPTYGKFGTRTTHVGANYENPIFLDDIITPIDQGCGRFPFGFCL